MYFERNILFLLYSVTNYSTERGINQPGVQPVSVSPCYLQFTCKDLTSKISDLKNVFPTMYGAFHLVAYHFSERVRE